MKSNGVPQNYNSFEPNNRQQQNISVYARIKVVNERHRQYFRLLDETSNKVAATASAINNIIHQTERYVYIIRLKWESIHRYRSDSLFERRYQIMSARHKQKGEKQKYKNKRKYELQVENRILSTLKNVPEKEIEKRRWNWTTTWECQNELTRFGCSHGWDMDMFLYPQINACIFVWTFYPMLSATVVLRNIVYHEHERQTFLTRFTHSHHRRWFFSVEMCSRFLSPKMQFGRKMSVS